MVADMIRRGQLTEAEAATTPTAASSRARWAPTPTCRRHLRVRRRRPATGCCCARDGLTGMLEDAMIAETLATYRDPAVAARALVDAANDAGGHDNISVVIVDIERRGRRARRRRRRRAARGAAAAGSPLIGWLLLFALVVGGVVLRRVPRTRSSRAYLAAENGVVVVYQGVPGSFAGITLSRPRRARPPSPSPTSTSRSRRGCRPDCRCHRSRRRSALSRATARPSPTTTLAVSAPATASPDAVPPAP